MFFIRGLRWCARPVYTERVIPALTSIGTNRTIDVTHLDRLAVFFCFGQETQHDAESIERAIRAQYSAAEVLIGHVVDLHSVPRMFRGMAEGILKSEYDKAVAALSVGETAEDYVVVLPDWDGAFIKSLAFAEDVSKRLGVAVFGRNGTLLGTVQSTDSAPKAIELLERAP